MIKDGKRINEVFIREFGAGCRPAHEKYYLPDEEDYWEATWYRRGRKEFKAISTREGTVGILNCTELWFNEHARDYTGQGVDLLVTSKSSVDKWIAGGRTAAVISGAYCLSSNLRGDDGRGAVFGGVGWIVEPKEGEVALTSPGEIIRTVESRFETDERKRAIFSVTEPRRKYTPRADGIFRIYGGNYNITRVQGFLI